MNEPLSPGVYGADDLSPGDRIDCGSVEVTAGMIDAFAELTGDRFEIHMSDEAARRHGFARRVAHGLLVLSLVDGLKNRAGARIRARASRGWDWRFRAPVLAGDRIAASLTVGEIRPARAPDQAIVELEFSVTGEDGTEVQRGANELHAYR